MIREIAFYQTLIAESLGQIDLSGSLNQAVQKTLDWNLVRRPEAPCGKTKQGDYSQGQNSIHDCYIQEMPKDRNGKKNQTLPFLILSLVAVITPGPNNVMITATGSAAGIVRGFVWLVLGGAMGLPRDERSALLFNSVMALALAASVVMILWQAALAAYEGKV